MVVSTRPAARRAAVRRLLLAVVSIALVAAATTWSVSGAEGRDYAKPVPRAECGPGARPETGRQGRVPTRDYTSGRAARGYRCNTRPVAHQGTTGGFKVLRYTDAAGHTCAFYDSTALFPKDVLFNAAQGLGVIVLDMSDPRHPRQTATLTTPAMLSPHESLLVNEPRGILAAVLSSPATDPGIVDLYDVRTDCRSPRLLSSTPTGVLGHESGMAPDGRTFYSLGNSGQTFAAVDISNPALPRTIFVQHGVNYHGVRLSDDGRTMYVADDGRTGSGNLVNGSLKILDVGQIQDRALTPQVEVLSSLTWPEVSIPQVAEPFTRNGRHYLLEVDEFANYRLDPAFNGPDAEVGAARIIDIEDPRHPHVVSDLRLEVHQPEARRTSQQSDPGAALPVQGYAAHYCSVPRRTDPRLVACSMIVSGLRIFDISRLRHPREVGYFNQPTLPGARPDQSGGFAMSQPAWDVARRSVWFSDVNSGFYDVRLTNGVGRLLGR